MAKFVEAKGFYAKQQNHCKMKAPEFSQKEEQRLEALHSYQILDTDVEKEFDEITILASELFDAKISSVSLVDRDRQWFKSTCGIKDRETSRDVSVCSYAIQTPNEVFEISDLSKDDRFKNFPIVTSEEKIRFYAGAPIVDKNGVALGTLCVLDDKPRTLTEKQKTRLQSLANMVMGLIESRLIHKHLNQYIEMQTKELKTALTNMKQEISKRKLIESRLEHTLNEERQISELRSHLVHSISHQFKTPLTTISTSTQLIDMISNPDDQRFRKHLGRILGAVQSMSDMIEDVLYLHKVDFTKLAESATEFDIGKSIHEIVDQINLESGSRNEILIEALEESTHEFHSNFPVIEKLLKILVSNAVKYNAPDSKIHIQYSVTGKSFQFNINNKGVPLNDENIGQIFDLFFRGNNIEEKEGLGIGLAIAKKLVDTLKGEIRVESTEEAGTTFFVMVPAIDVSKNQHAA